MDEAQIKEGRRLLAILLEKLTIEEVKMLTEQPIDSGFVGEAGRRAVQAAIKADGL